ncbi:10671_t:CDS:2 [Entrophospora sp. SA101]|nr:10671_t:CDS:2 [Entrophospora sp. SA101]
MPQKSSKSAAAKNRNNKQNQNSDTGQFTFTTKSDDEYLPSCEYSEDSSDDDFVAEKFQQLSESKKLIWTKEADVKGKKPYTGKSRATYYKKYGPSGKYTKAASFSQSITHFFPIESKGINELDEENTMSELNSSEGENDSGHESESNESSEQESDFEVENDNSLEPKLTELENILSIVHPNAVAVFAFDNSTNHGSMAKDALNVNNMNVYPGGKQALMRPTVYGPNKKPQLMIFPPDHPIYQYLWIL